MKYNPIKDLGIDPTSFLQNKVDTMQQRVSKIQTPSPSGEVMPFQLPGTMFPTADATQKASTIPSKLKSKIDGLGIQNVSQSGRLPEAPMQEVGDSAPPAQRSNGMVGIHGTNLDMNNLDQGGNPGDVNYSMDQTLDDLYTAAELGLQEDQMEENFPEIPQEIRGDLLKAINLGLPKEEIRRNFPEMKSPMKEGETILGDIAGGINKSAQGVAEWGEYIGNWLGEKVSRLILKQMGKSDEEIEESIAKWREQADKRGVKSFVDEFNVGIGANPDSAAYKISKTVGDVAQVADVWVAAVDLLKGSKVAAKSAELRQKAKTMNLDDATKTALSKTLPKELDEYVEITQKAIADDAMPTASAKAAGKVDDAIKTIEDTTKEAGREIWDIRLAAADSRTYTQPMVESMNENLSKLGKVEIKYSLKKGYELVDSSRVWVLAKDEKALLETFVSKLNKIKKETKISDIMDLNEFLKNNASKVENASRTFQSMVSTVRKSINETIGEQVPAEYKWLMQKYSKWQDMLEKIEKAFGEEGQRGQTALNRLFSKSNESARELFEMIKKETGVDLFKEARLSKFVMEAMGDTRGLQQILENVADNGLNAMSRGKSLVKGAANKVVGSPIEQAQDFIKPKLPATSIPKDVTDKRAARWALDAVDSLIDE